RYRAKNASLRWGEDESQALEDWPSGGSVRCRSLTLTGLRGLAPGMVMYLESTSDEIDFAAETRT
ncbi:MAG: hypothetical protein GX605_05165, partial [Chloroflexi bacterium]|nr:hypothetical protein [Chloroflexota bacterium]